MAAAQCDHVARSKVFFTLCSEGKRLSQVFGQIPAVALSDGRVGGKSEPANGWPGAGPWANALILERLHAADAVEPAVARHIQQRLCINRKEKRFDLHGLRDVDLLDFVTICTETAR